MDVIKAMESIFRDIFDDNTITLNEEMSADDIEGWDSLAQIRLIIAMEKHFNIRFHTEEVGRVGNVGEMAQLIQKMLG